MYEVKGMIAAMPTPFLENEDLNTAGIEALVAHLAEGGLDGVIAGGSTGEYVMLSVKERMVLIEEACKAAGGRLPVLAGTGCPSLRETLQLCKFAARAGASANLVITPYYMGTTKEALLNYYITVAQQSPLPVILYHFPGAAGVSLTPEEIRELAEIENIIGVKNTEDMDHTAKVLAVTRGLTRFCVATGYDSLALPAFLMGGDASMGVVHNVAPKMMAQMYEKIKESDFRTAREIAVKLEKLIILLEREPYPGPVKAALELLGLPAGLPRRPVCGASEELKGAIGSELSALGLL